MLSSKKNSVVGPLWWNIEIIGFSDGAWKKFQDGKVLSDICGILIDNKRKVLYSFYGNLNAMSALEAEMNAILFPVCQVHVKSF